MKKVIIGVLLLTSMSAMAQETYSNANIATEDLNGTARYVGMGGAMEALGADISTIGTNPAGIGMFRKSQVAMSMGLVSQQDCGENRYGDATNVSFDQIGFVWTNSFDNGKYLNFGFNYKKSRNFNNILNVQGSLNNSSQNLNSYMNLMDADSRGDYDREDWNVSQLDVLYEKTLLMGATDGNLYYNTASGYDLSRANKGYVGEYDFNISGNVSQRLFLGFTLGIKDVNFKSYTSYIESLLDANNNSIGDIEVVDYREITGTGFDLKAGAIFFPFEDSPFRIGVDIATPTWYDLNTYNNTYLNNAADINGLDPVDANYESEGGYDYKVFTPWKFGLSVGHTFDNYIAVGASYEYADYSHLKSRIIDGYDEYGTSTSSNDVNMNEHTDMTLRGVSTFKIGTEVKPTAEWAVRLGYNYVTPMYRHDAYFDGTISSPGIYYSSTTDYTNWKGTNRLTCGVGYSKGAFGIDLAYQYSVCKGEFKPFMDSSATYTWEDGSSLNVANSSSPVEISNKRHQLLATVTYKF